MPGQSQSGGGGIDEIQGHAHLKETNDGGSRQSPMDAASDTVVPV